MRIAKVIGTVILSRPHPALTGFRFVIGVPYGIEDLQKNRGPGGEELVIYDDLGAGQGSLIGFSESGEAAAPFYPEKKPIDAYCACMLDTVSISK